MMSRSASAFFFAVYLGLAGLLVVGSLAPFDFLPIAWSDAVQQFRERLGDAMDFSRDRDDLAINFSIAIPMACGAMATLESLGLGLGLALLSSAAAGVSLAMGVEFAQVWLPTRDPSLRDVVAQSAGHGAGILLWLMFRRRTLAWAAALPAQQHAGQRIVWLSYAYLVGVVFYLLLPLDIVSSPGELLNKFKTQQVELTPFSFPYSTLQDALYAYLCDTLRFVPVGILCGARWRRHASRAARWQPPWEALLAGAAIVIALEAAQLFVARRFTSVTDVLFGALGIAVGVAITPWLLRATGDERSIAGNRDGKRDPSSHSPPGADATRRRAGWLLATLAYAVVLTAVFWSGDEYVQDANAIRQRLAGFRLDSDAWRSHIAGSDVGNMFSLLQKLAWFLPLGILAGGSSLAMPPGASSRRSYWMSTALALACAAVALLIEAGQVPLVDHTPSLIDAGIGTLSAWAGMGVAALLFSRTSDERPADGD